VAGIIVFAVGARNAVEHVADPLSDPARLAFCGGVALYLAGNVGFALRMLGSLNVDKLAAAVACLAVFAAGGELDAWATAALVAGVLGVLVLRETRGTRAPAL
jgi:low temperature requirement protein LtrA